MDKYTGPDFATVNAIDERAFEVRSNSGKRIGVYSNPDMAHRVAADFDRTSLKAHLKAQKKAAK